MQTDLAADIQKGTELKKAETKDSSAPVIDPETKMKTVDRKALVEGVTQPQELKKTETRDASAPVIPADANVTSGKRGDMLRELSSKQGA